MARKRKSNNSHPISDHALLRYIERVLGGDIVAMKNVILTDDIIAAIKSGATGIKKDGFYYSIKDGYVTTVIKD